MRSDRRTIRIGSGSGCAEDWLEPAIELVERGRLDYICFDSLSESELSNVAYARSVHADHPGYDVYLDERMRRILPGAVANGTKIIGNMGSADPLAAQAAVLKIAKELGIDSLRVAAVTGDNLMRNADLLGAEVVEKDGTTVSDLGDRLISAHAYVPVGPVVEALREGADVVLTGRIGDSGMYLAAQMYEFGWSSDDWDTIAKGIIVGHLLECAAQLSGGYFADPPYKVVPDLYRVGYPLAEVSSDGEVVFTKVEGSGGVVNVDTCIEQMLYETHDPTNYIYPDAVIDFSDIEFEQIAPDRVRMGGVIRGRPAPEKLKVALGVREGYLGQGVVYYGGVGAYARAKLAAEVARDRLALIGFDPAQLHIGLLGVNGLYGDGWVDDAQAERLWEVGLRVVARTETAREAELVGRVGATNMAMNGPASVTAAHGTREAVVRPLIGYEQAFVPREKVTILQSYSIAEV